MFIDLSRCVGCRSCTIACKAEHQVMDNKSRTWVRNIGPDHTASGIGMTFYPGHCNHCDRPACVPVCPVQPISKKFLSGAVEKNLDVAATWKDPFNGSVLIDIDRCIGCGACVEACPYGARYLYGNGVMPKADKCDFCQERLGAGLEPACVSACVGGARLFGDLHSPSQKMAAYLTKGTLRLESESVFIGPNVYYSGNEKELFLFKKSVIPTSLPRISARRVFLGAMGKNFFSKKIYFF